VFGLRPTGLALFGSATAPTVGTAGGVVAIEGTAFTGTSTNYGWYTDSTLHCFDIINQTTNQGCAAGEAAIIGANLIPKAIGTTPGIVASSITDNGTNVSTAEPIIVGTAAGSPGITDKTIGYLATSMGVQSTATCTNITNMTWNVAANKNYVMHCSIPMTFAASATVAFCMGGPGTPTSHTINAVGSLGVAGAYADINVVNSATYGTKTTASGAVGASTQVVLVDATIQNGATASGTALTLQTAGNGTNNITVLKDSACTLQQAN